MLKYRINRSDFFRFALIQYVSPSNSFATYITLLSSSYHQELMHIILIIRIQWVVEENKLIANSMIIENLASHLDERELSSLPPCYCNRLQEEVHFDQQNQRVDRNWSYLP